MNAFCTCLLFVCLESDGEIRFFVLLILVELLTITVQINVTEHRRGPSKILLLSQRVCHNMSGNIILKFNEKKVYLWVFFAVSCVQHILCCVCVLFFFVLCTLCYQFFTIQMPWFLPREHVVEPISNRYFTFNNIYS
jgi:hypothetical protein